MPRTNRGDAMRAEAAAEKDQTDPLAPENMPAVPRAAAMVAASIGAAAVAALQTHAAADPGDQPQARVKKPTTLTEITAAGHGPNGAAEDAPGGHNPRGLWTVFDTLAKTERRTHTPLPGFDYPLSATAPTEMPPAHAMKFLCDEAFKVFDEYGNAVKALPKVDVEAATGGVILKPGQTVASLDELTDNALKARCAQMPKGHTVAAAGDRLAMVRHIAGEQINRELRREELLKTTDDAKIINEQSGGHAEKLSHRDIERMIPSARLQDMLKG